MKKILLLLFIGVSFLTACHQKNAVPNLKDDSSKVSEVKKSVKKSNDCSDYIITETDKMTGKTSIYSKNIVVSDDGVKTGFLIFLIPTKETIILSIRVSGAGNCIDKGSKVNFLFSDNSKLEMYNHGDFNCKANVTLYLGGPLGNKSDLHNMETKKIKAMRVWTEDGYVEKDFTDENADDFYNTFQCIMK